MTTGIEHGAGYSRRVAHVNLTTSEVHYEHPDTEWYRRFGGGGAAAPWYLLRESKQGVDALSPHKVMVFAGSFVSGAEAPGLTKHTVVAKGPLTGIAGESQCVSPFGTAFKRSGIDLMVIIGAASRPSAIVTDEGHVRVVAVPELCGAEAADAAQQLGLRIPEELSVIAVHDIPLAELGRLAVERLALAATSRVEEVVSGDMGLVERSSNGPARSGQPPMIDTSLFGSLAVAAVVGRTAAVAVAPADAGMGRN